MADEETRESTLEEIISRIDPAQLNQDDHAILLRLVHTLDEVERLYEGTNLILSFNRSIVSSGTICATGMWKTRRLV